MRKFTHAVALLAVLVLGDVCCFARPLGESALEVTVVGQTTTSYKRQKLPDGSIKPEGFAIARGGMVPGTTWDESVEKVRFPVIAAVVTHHLAKQNYFLAPKLEDRDLLIVVHWGTTLGYEGVNYSQSVERNADAMSAVNQTGTRLEAMKHGVLSGTTEEMEVLEKDKQRASDDLESSLTMTGLENRGRDMANLDNARLLGYLDAINTHRDSVFADMSGTTRDLMRDVEERRYYVTVSAYDFRAAREEKKQVLRWVTRISIRATGNSFDERMAQMVAAAAGTFGRKRDLSRRFYADPRVDLGDVEYLGVAAPADAAGEKEGR